MHWIVKNMDMYANCVVMTELLYLNDSYMKNTSACVSRAADCELVFDKTIFYPGGGGQKPDTGIIRWESGNDHCEAHVIGARKDGEDVVHVLSPDSAMPPKGTTVEMSIDWDRRHQMMRVHTSLHLLSSVIWKEHGAQITGGDIKPGLGKLDFNLERSLDPDVVSQIESKVQQLIANDLPVIATILPRDEAYQIPDLIRLKVDRLPKDLMEIRVVEIKDTDIQADGGLHVASTKEIGGFKITKRKNKGKGRKRLEIAVE